MQPAKDLEVSVQQANKNSELFTIFIIIFLNIFNRVLDFCNLLYNIFNKTLGGILLWIIKNNR